MAQLCSHSPLLAGRKAAPLPLDARLHQLAHLAAAPAVVRPLWMAELSTIEGPASYVVNGRPKPCATDLSVRRSARSAPMLAVSLQAASIWS